MNNEDVLDNVETLLAYLICGQAKNISNPYTNNMSKHVGEEFDVGEILHFDPMTPNNVYTCAADDDRILAGNTELLLNSPQDIFGKQAEIALLCEDRVKWSGYKKINKRPKNVWVGAAGADLYEWHYREILISGQEIYGKRLVAFNKHGKPVSALVSGSKGSSGNDGILAIHAASLIEDAHRPDALKATVKEDASIIFPVPLGDHKEVFALREAPLTPTGRRKAILHWVKKHTRKTEFSNADVKQHWRGVKEITIDGLQVKLEGQK